VTGGLLKKVRLLRRHAPRNDTKRLFQVITSDSKNRAAISKCSFGTFSTAPLSIVFFGGVTGKAREGLPMSILLNRYIPCGILTSVGRNQISHYSPENFLIVVEEGLNFKRG